jgi:hypothetical protein
MKRGYVLMIAGSILVAAGLLIVIPSVYFLYSFTTSISVNDIIRVVLQTILGRFERVPDSLGSEASVPRVPIAMSVAGIVVSPILMVDGAITLIAGSILSITDKRKEHKSAALHRP